MSTCTPTPTHIDITKTLTTTKPLYDNPIIVSEGAL